jgi:hypothetical protein
MPLADTEPSRALVARVREQMARLGVRAAGPVRVSLEISTRSSGFAGTGAVTADWVATVQAQGMTHVVQGHVMEFGESTLRNTAIEKATAEIVAVLQSAKPAP